MSRCVICAETFYLTCVPPRRGGTSLAGENTAESKDSFTDLCAAAGAW